MPAPRLRIKPLTYADSAWVRAFLLAHWHSDTIVVHGEVFWPNQLPGFIGVLESERVGLLTYRISGSSCEIITLDSLRPGVGIGSALVEAVKIVAQQVGCARLWLITTNDNLNALGFYQKRGFVLVAIHREAIAKARQLKPSIPYMGDNGIPIRDEVELELVLSERDSAV